MDIPASSVVALGTQLQTGFYGFNGSYSLGTVLQAGRGYWVKVSSAGRLLMQSAGVASGAAEPAALPPENLQTLTFLDAEGSVQTLYYGAASPGDSLDGRYELPPVPPEGVYDVRFTGSGLVHTAMTSDGRLRERAIAATGLRYPVRVRWSGTHDLRLQCVLEYAGGGRTHRIVLSAGEHEAVIPGPAASGFVLKPAVPDVPLTFALGQNFPNPFNPVTQVEFSVARAGRVRLSVFDQLGREVGVIVDEDLAPGFYRRTIDGGSLASGVYYYRLRAEGFSATRRMVLLR